MDPSGSARRASPPRKVAELAPGPPGHQWDVCLGARSKRGWHGDTNILPILVLGL